MSSNLKPIVLYGHGPSPNPVKVAIVLEELGIPYTVKNLDFETEIKAEPYISLNPNGRVPTIEDPNTDTVVFESGAILEYLMETYDPEFELHTGNPKKKWVEKSWLFFQVSGQGPYFGQKVWFEMYHLEKLPSAIDRYRNEVKRVTGVINSHLKKQGTQYLLGDRLSYVDLAFVPWQNLYPVLVPEWDLAAEVPDFAAWRQRLMERASVKKVVAHEALQR